MTDACDDADDEMPIVEFELDAGELPRHAGRRLPEGVPVEIDYDSSYGGEQTVRGELDKVTHDELLGAKTAAEARRLGKARHGDVLIGDRIIRKGTVRSVRDRRQVGRLKRARVQVPLDRAIDVISQYGSYDVDRGDGETIVQWWDEPLTDENHMERTGSVRLPHIEDGEPVNERYEPFNSWVRDRERRGLL